MRAVEKHALPLRGEFQDFDSIVEASRDKQHVLLGEASHGTHEFYLARVQITERLLKEANL